MRGAWIALLLVAGGLAVAAEEPTAPTIDDDIRQLLRRTTPEPVIKQMMAQTLEPIRRGETGVPDEFGERFLASVRVDELIEGIIPVYARHFMQQDIRGMTACFESPVRRKFLEKQPLVMQESIAVGQAWGTSLVERVQAELEAERRKDP